MKKVWPIVFLNIIIVSFLSASLQDIYKKGTIKLEPSPGFGGGTDWEALFYDGAKQVIVTGEGSIFVSNSAQHNIYRFTPSGQFLTKFGQKGLGPNDLYFPGQLTILDGKYLVIGEYASTRRINLFDFTGKCFKVLRTDYNAFGALALKNNKVAYIASQNISLKVGKRTVFIKDVDSGKESPAFTGEVLGKNTIIIDGLFLGFDNQTGVLIIAQTGDGNLLVGLSSTATIRIYSPEGKLIRTFELNMKPLPASDRYIEAFRDFTISEMKNGNDQTPPETIKKIEKIAFKEMFNANLPYYRDIYVDSEGNILVFKWTECISDCKKIFQVYAPDGKYICETTIDEGNFKFNVDNRSKKLAFWGKSLIGLFELRNSEDISLRLVKVDLK